MQIGSTVLLRFEFSHPDGQTISATVEDQKSCQPGKACIHNIQTPQKKEDLASSTYPIWFCSCVCRLVTLHTEKGLQETKKQRSPFFLPPSCATELPQLSRLVMSDSFRPHELQHARPLCPSQNCLIHTYINSLKISEMNTWIPSTLSAQSSLSLRHICRHHEMSLLDT